MDTIKTAYNKSIYANKAGRFAVSSMNRMDILITYQTLAFQIPSLHKYSTVVRYSVLY